eukprot:1147357-Pelagomonas_calceolata.AAC.4
MQFHFLALHVCTEGNDAFGFHQLKVRQQKGISTLGTHRHNLEFRQVHGKRPSTSHTHTANLTEGRARTWAKVFDARASQMTECSFPFKMLRPDSSWC